LKLDFFKVWILHLVISTYSIGIGARSTVFKVAAIKVELMAQLAKV